MNSPIFSAPGKIVIAGEYAVLDGAEALACSVDRHVFVKRSDRHCERSEATQENMDCFTTLATTKHLDRSVVACVLEELSSRGLEVTSQEFEIDSSALQLETPDSRLKLGLGSSAAVTVALTRALLAPLGPDPQSEFCFSLSLAAHRRFTRSLGSGIDVAASFFGGMIRYRQQENRQPSVIRCESLFDLRHVIAVHTGIAQSTNVFLERIALAKARHREDYQRAIAGIENAALSIINVMTSNPLVPHAFTRLRTGVLDHNKWMNTLGHLADIDIISDAHKRIASIAERHGGASKPSGAGGGDLALCFIDFANREAFLQELNDRAYFWLPLQT